MQMVSEHSAVPSKPSEDPHYQLSRDVDHSGISKFQDRSDQDYVVFRQRIVDCTQVDTAPLQERYSGLSLTLLNGTKPADLTLYNN